jgi:hypothetical protein
MPGAYAHLTMVNMAKESAHLEKLNFSNPAASALLKYFKYCELGAVSPDYPYLAIGDITAEKWANLMHYDRTGEVLRAGILRAKVLQGDQRERAFAWLLGYSAHVATDVTIHPVVELKVGPYAQNKKAHRVCEMHQDAYIWGTRMNLGGVGVSKHLASGILRCTEANHPGAVDSTIKELWEHMLRSVHPTEAKTNPPQVDKWHKGFDLVVNSIAGEGHRLFPFARHVAANQGLTYPTFDEVDRKEYIDELKAPPGPLHYDVIFDHAKHSVGKTWSLIEKAVYGDDADAISFFGDWDLDTGRNNKNELIFWV